MAGEMTATAALLPQGLDGVAYACTSGATIIGPDRVEALVQMAHPGVPVTNPLSSVVAALGELGMSPDRDGDALRGRGDRADGARRWRRMASRR